MITVARTDDAPAPTPPAVGAASVRNLVPHPRAEPEAPRFTLTDIYHKYQLTMTASLLAGSQAVLDRWRDRVGQ
ncbi:MAG: hypothetical protein J2P17_07700 [Mycobacterium sp.]|nr:hypothetical protein [Mycobacterium sp.]